MSSSAVTSEALGSSCRTGGDPLPVQRTWLLTNAPSPYQGELFTAVSRRPEIDLAVRLMRPQSDAGRAVDSEFASIVMAGLAPRSWRDEVRLHPRAITEAAFGRFDCFVLSGLYTSVTFLCCALLLRLRGKPWIMWLERPHVEGDFGGSATRSTWVRRRRDGVRRWLIRSASRVLCIGRAAQEAYRRLGAAPDKLDLLPYCCDLSRYDVVNSQEIRDVKEQFGLDGMTTYLFSGQLIPRKGVETVIRAFARLGSESEDVALVLLGDGRQREELESLVSSDVANRVHFAGHLPQDRLPAVFRAADVFVFPSRHDGWAVVVNEACAARLPIIASDQTGAAHDLVEPGVSGFRHDAADVDAFYQSMKYLAEHPRERERMGQRSRELVEQFSPQRGAQLFSNSVFRAVQGDASKRPSDS